MNLSSAWIALALSLSLAASLLGNAWQWRHSGIAVTRAEGVTDRCTDANAAAAAASTAQSEALWKCVGEDQIAEVTAANSAAHAARARHPGTAQRHGLEPDLGTGRTGAGRSAGRFLGGLQRDAGGRAARKTASSGL